MSKEKGENINFNSDGRKFMFMPIQKKEQVVKNAAEKLIELHSTQHFNSFESIRRDLKLNFISNSWSETLFHVLKSNELDGMRDTNFSDLVELPRTSKKKP